MGIEQSINFPEMHASTMNSSENKTNIPIYQKHLIISETEELSTEYLWLYFLQLLSWCHKLKKSLEKGESWMHFDKKRRDQDRLKEWDSYKY